MRARPSNVNFRASKTVTELEHWRSFTVQEGDIKEGLPASTAVYVRSLLF
jgi:hypothetical protein